VELAGVVGTNGNGSHHPPAPEPAAAGLNGRIPDLVDGVMEAVDVPPVDPGPPFPSTPAFPPKIDEAGSESRVAGRAGVEAG
jgi:hypothetical protein